jgi:small subunit ribosomal protein S11
MSQQNPEATPAAAPAAPAAPAAAGAAAATSSTAPAAASSKKGKRNVPRAIVHVQASFNNTIITIADPSGETLCWDSAGTIGFKGSRKSTPFAAQKAAEKAAEKAMKMGVREVEVRVNGPGAGRESAIRSLASSGLKVRAIEDVTPIPHNGCRPRKRRRV